MILSYLGHPEIFNRKTIEELKNPWIRRSYLGNLIISIREKKKLYPEILENDLQLIQNDFLLIRGKRLVFRMAEVWIGCERVISHLNLN